MNTNNLKIQRFRTNDIVDDGGKQFELGRSWCEDFFGFSDSQQSVNVQLKFKPLDKSQEKFSDKVISLELSGVTKRGDRKAYTNGNNNRSDIKNFFINDLHLTVANNLNDYFAVYKSPSNEYYLYFIPELLYKNFIRLFETIAPNVSVINENRNTEFEKKPILTESFQQIFYGAPGTGKSHTIKEMTKGEDVNRTTFHPDTDYSGFVGAYKPTTSLLPICNELGEPMKIANQALYKEQIVYEFVAQSFLQAYIAAWKKYANSENVEPEKQYLVIEEINRGNCAQIFGDLFQLLDRNDYGFSEYPIQTDADMKKQLHKVFKGLDISQKDSINAMYEGRDVVKEVLNGDILLLPNNLYIWATMNTSDQSLFPIDSAFKRRWDWTYITISNANKGWTINIGDAHYDWWQFVERINDLIGRTTNSEDKKLGYFFCKAKDGVIAAETFVGKVIFYLWNDVFKDYDFCDLVFNDADGNKLTFDKFYTAEGNNSRVIEEKVELFLKNLGLEASVQQGNMDEDIDSKIVVKVNGKDVTKINAIPYTAIEEYVKLHREMSAQEIVDVWGPFKKYSADSWIISNKEEDYSYEIKCNDGNSLWVNKNGWMHNPAKQRDTISEFIKAVNDADLGITITETTI